MLPHVLDAVRAGLALKRVRPLLRRRRSGSRRARCNSRDGRCFNDIAMQILPVGVDRNDKKTNDDPDHGGERTDRNSIILG